MDEEQASLMATVIEVVRLAPRFDVIHAHLDWSNLLVAALADTPVAMTFHGRLDYSFAPRLLSYAQRGLVAISAAQQAGLEDLPWEGVVYNGLDLAGSPFGEERTDSLCFVGRMVPEKGVVDAIEIARLSGRHLRIAAKTGGSARDTDYFETHVKPAAAQADVEFLGELSGADRDRLFAESFATLMPGAWPEPFGLVAIESLACGTPVICRPTGALPEIVRDGVDGFHGDDAQAMAFRLDRVDTLDRRSIRSSVLERFSATRMTDGYERIYRRLAGGRLPDEIAIHFDARRGSDSNRDRQLAALAEDLGTRGSPPVVE